jgi:hypothetical protein
MHLFRKNKEKENDQETLKEIKSKVDHLETLLEQISQRNVVETINIEKLSIENPVVKSLTFRLDKLDVDEVSGALNLGNNFGTRVNQKQSSPKKEKRSNIKQEKPKKSSGEPSKNNEEPEEEETILFKQTSNGFTFKMNAEN